MFQVVRHRLPPSWPHLPCSTAICWLPMRSWRRASDLQSSSLPPNIPLCACPSLQPAASSATRVSHSPVQDGALGFCLAASCTLQNTDAIPLTYRRMPHRDPSFLWALRHTGTCNRNRPNASSRAFIPSHPSVCLPQFPNCQLLKAGKRLLGSTLDSGGHAGGLYRYATLIITSIQLLFCPIMSGLYI